ncbi:sorting nexin-33-like isoform X3 [Ostrea edulis]|uniref:sorting nexin-33-like isoform X3 n=1 Tax=Ostrea edulis TaxID=37623 RepID=UPI0024AED531|nr:sorting nexin-33-like isoform X3 [Ostrea edulis]
MHSVKMVTTRPSPHHWLMLRRKLHVNVFEKAVQARGLYDFDGDTDNGELTFGAGETLTIVAQDIGEGWWEAKNESGQQGLIPESYVQLLEPPEPSFPPPPPPSAPNDDWNTPQGGGGNWNSHTTDSWDHQPPAPDYTNHNSGYNNQGFHAGGIQQQASEETWDDDWDDDNEDNSSNSTTNTSQPTETKPEGQGTAPTEQDQLPGSGNFGLSAPKRERKQLSPNSDVSKYGTVKKSFNRFSTFAKTGGDAFLMGTVSANVSESDLIKIIDTVEGPAWNYPSQPYTCSVKSPKKESKLKGLKSYIAYQLTPSFSNIQVSRRYKHFDWLHERLEAKFSCVPISPLPDKAISGRYEDDFVSERMRQLQLWVDRIVRHPVISQSEVFNHFLTCTDEKKWKAGKRKAEKDEYQGGKFFLTLQTPPSSLDMRDVEKRMEIFCKFVKNMDDNVRNMLQIGYDSRKKHLGPYKREFQKIGGAFKQLAETFNLDSGSRSQHLTGAIDYTGDTYNEIGEMYEKQPREDLDHMIEVLFEYKGMLSTYPDVLKLHEGAVGKAKECERLKDEGRMPESDVTSVIQRADVISYGTLAEMNHFQMERVTDYKEMMQKFLTGQIKFYREITQKLESALQKYDDA